MALWFIRSNTGACTFVPCTRQLRVCTTSRAQSYSARSQGCCTSCSSSCHWSSRHARACRASCSTPALTLPANSSNSSGQCTGSDEANTLAVDASARNAAYGPMVVVVAVRLAFINRNAKRVCHASNRGPPSPSSLTHSVRGTFRKTSPSATSAMARNPRKPVSGHWCATTLGCQTPAARAHCMNVSVSTVVGDAVAAGGAGDVRRREEC